MSIFFSFSLFSSYRISCVLPTANDGITTFPPLAIVSNIIDNLEIYNDIYKTLNKKSLIYKSHVNTIHTKIQNIGNKDALENRLLNLTNREKQINSKILELNNNKKLTIYTYTIPTPFDYSYMGEVKHSVLQVKDMSITPPKKMYMTLKYDQKVENDNFTKNS